MSNYKDLLKYTSFSFRDKIKKYCTPLLKHFSINHFSYVKITNSGHFTCLSSRPEWMEYYFEEKFYLVQPHFRHPSIHKTGISFPGLIQNQSYQDAMQIAQSKFQIYPSLIFSEKKDDGIDFFSFDLNSSQPVLNALLFNELPLLRKFTHMFQQENSSLFKLSDMYQINLIDLMGTDFYLDTDPIVASLSNRPQCLNELGLGLKTSEKLSAREITIMQYLLHGASANQIGDLLCLSKRTIEHYIERLKNKLVCHSKMDLILKGRELEALGYLRPSEY